MVGPVVRPVESIQLKARLCKKLLLRENSRRNADKIGFDWEASMSKISLKRKSAWIYKIRSWKVFLDGSEIGKIKNGGVWQHECSAGQHTLHLKVDFYESQELKFDSTDNIKDVIEFDCAFDEILLLECTSHPHFNQSVNEEEEGGISEEEMSCQKSTIDVAHVKVNGSNKGNFTNCTSCSREIAKTASHCPQCGAKNEYINPRIKANLKKIERLDLGGEYEFFYGGDSIQFTVTKAKNWDSSGTSAIFKALGCLMLVPITNFLDNFLPTILSVVLQGAVVLAFLYFAGKFAICFFAVAFGGDSDSLPECEVTFDEDNKPHFRSNDQERFKPIQDLFMDKEKGRDSAA